MVNLEKYELLLFPSFGTLLCFYKQTIFFKILHLAQEFVYLSLTINIIILLNDIDSFRKGEGLAVYKKEYL